jgi:Tfp pilus assembly protein PilN
MSTLTRSSGQVTATATTPSRIPSIAVNLLPTEITDGRRSRKVRKIVIATVVGFAVVVLAGYGVAATLTSVASLKVSDSVAQTHRLTQQQRQYAEVTRVQAESKAINAQLAALLANDLQWSALVSSLRTAAPPGVRVLTVAAALTPAPGAGAAKAAPAPPAQETTTPGTKAAPAAAARTIGSLTVSGTGTSKDALAAFLDELATVSGLANPLLTSVTVQDDEQSYTMHVDITAAALGGRYTANATTGPRK